VGESRPARSGSSGISLSRNRLRPTPSESVAPLPEPDAGVAVDGDPFDENVIASPPAVDLSRGGGHEPEQPAVPDVDAAPTVDEPAKSATNATAAAPVRSLDGGVWTPDLSRLASLPRVGEAPRPADRVRFGSVPRRPEARPAERGRPGDDRFGPVGAPAEPDSGHLPPVAAEATTTALTRSTDFRSTESRPTESRSTDFRSADAEPVEARPGGGSGVRLTSAPMLGGRVRLEEVEVSTHGLDAFVQVHLSVDGQRSVGAANGPALDGYVLRLCAAAAASALDDLLSDPGSGQPLGRCYVEHAAIVPFGTTEVAVVVILLVCGGWVEQLAGSALVSGDGRQAIVRAALAAVNRRLEAMLP